MNSTIQDLYNNIIKQTPALLQATANAPYIGPNYGSDPNCKILVIFSSALPLPTPKGLPLGTTNWTIEQLYEQYHCYPNYSRILDYYSSTNLIRFKIEEAIKSVSPNKSIQDIAHYHFILRPLRGPFDRPTPIDLDKSIDAFVKTIDILKPTSILFYGNDCLRTISRRSFSKAVENKSVVDYLSSKGIVFATISLRSDYQAKTSDQITNNKSLGIKVKINKYENKFKIPEDINLPKYKNQFKNILDELNNHFAALEVDSATNKKIFETKILPTMKSLIEEIESLNNKINPNKSNKSDNSLDDFGMAQKIDLITKLALNNQKNNTTTYFSQLAEELNKAGIKTARGETFSTTTTRGLRSLLVKVFEKSITIQHDYNTTLAIATTFINEKTGLPWILNELVDNLINQKLAFYENGVLKSKLSHKPITEQDIAPEIINETPMKLVDNKIKHEIIEYFANKQKAAGNKEIRESSPQEEKHHF